jgi:hypothetical protein
VIVHLVRDEQYSRPLRQSSVELKAKNPGDNPPGKRRVILHTAATIIVMITNTSNPAKITFGGNSRFSGILTSTFAGRGAAIAVRVIGLSQDLIVTQHVKVTLGGRETIRKLLLPSSQSETRRA